MRHNICFGFPRLRVAPPSLGARWGFPCLRGHGLPCAGWLGFAAALLLFFLALLCLVSVSEKSELLLRARHLGVCTRLNDAGLGRLPLCEGWLWSPSCLRRGQAPCALGNLESATACGLPRTTTLVMVACRLEQTCGGGRVDPCFFLLGV